MEIDFLADVGVDLRHEISFFIPPDGGMKIGDDLPVLKTAVLIAPISPAVQPEGCRFRRHDDFLQSLVVHERDLEKRFHGMPLHERPRVAGMADFTTTTEKSIDKSPGDPKNDAFTVHCSARQPYGNPAGESALGNWSMEYPSIRPAEVPCSAIASSRLSAMSEAAIRYRHLLGPYEEALSLMADLERIEHGRRPVEMDSVKRLYDRLQLAVQKMLVALGDLGDHRCEELLRAHQYFDRQTAPLFEPALSMPTQPILVSLRDVRADMASFVGHKAANLAVIGHAIGLPVPDGFVLTARAFDRFMEENELPGVIDAYLHDITVDNAGPIHERCETIRRIILQAPVPADIEAAAQAALARWQADRGGALFIAVRSTAVGEDAEISFAGQFATLLNVPVRRVLDAFKEVVASKYSSRAILYRMRYGLDDRSAPMAVMIMPMIQAMASGVVYTRNPSLPDQADLRISAIRGLGEYLMSGDAAPHVFSVCQRTGRVAIRHAAPQTHWMTTAPGGGTRLASVPPGEQNQPPIDDASARCLADWGQRLEKYFGSPQDVEWARDRDGRLFVLQSRPLGLDGAPATAPGDDTHLKTLPVLHAGGRKACSGMVTGRIHHVGKTMSEPIPADSILVIPKASPEYAPMVARVRGVIAARGSAASHLASVAREFGVPMIVDAGSIDSRWNQGQWVTLHADTATVYAGRIGKVAEAPARTFPDPFETPVRRRLRALSNRIIPCRCPSPDDPSPTALPRSINDLLGQAHRFAMETLLTRGPRSDAGIQILRWNRDNAAGDFDIAPAGEKMARKRPPGTPAGHPSGRALLQALCCGLAWDAGGPRSEGGLETDGYAFIGDRSLRATLSFGSQQAIVEAFRAAGQEAAAIRILITGGDDPFYKRCLRIEWLAAVLDEMGFSVRINGALLEASAVASGSQPDHGLLQQIGRLLAFSRQADQSLLGPWAIESLKSAFMAAARPWIAPAADLPPALIPLSGNWRQATLNGRSVIVQEGLAVGNWALPSRQQPVGHPSPANRPFFEQLHRDHFFPLAIADASRMQDGRIDLALNLLGGRHACAGGAAFGFRDPGHHLMVGLDARHNCIILYESLQGRRFKRLRKRYPVHTDRWYDLSLEIAALSVHIQLNGVPMMAYIADRPIAGQVGMWAWNDTLIVFDGLALMDGTRREVAF